MTKRKQIVGYVEPAIWERIRHINQKYPFLTISIIVRMAVNAYVPQLERDIAKGKLPHLGFP